MLTNADIAELTDLRRDLHRHPEVSGREEDTARRIVAALVPLQPAQVLMGLGGHGVAAVFEGAAPGPTVLFRAELDALPIPEVSRHDWVSTLPGTGHLCGHDGHMTLLMGLGRLLARQPVARGRVVLMFQPAEEDGSGARAVVADPAFSAITPDWAFAIHNEPGRALGRVGIRAGLMNCASQGLAITLQGRTAHAANPETGISPAVALSRLIPELTALGRGGALDEDFRLATVTHARLGEPTFGISPGEAEIFVTLRTARDAALDGMEAEARDLVTTAAQAEGLQATFSIHDRFAASINNAEAVAVARGAMDALGIAHSEDSLPMRASEDFGVFGWGARSAMLCLGSGEDHAALHNPDYDFPDDLIPQGVRIFERIARDLLSRAEATAQAVPSPA